MPEPTQIYNTSQRLTNMAIAYDTGAFISPRLIAELPVVKESGAYYIFDTERRDAAPVDDQRQPGAQSNTVDFQTTTGTYKCEGHYLKGFVTDEDRANADSIFALDADKTENIVSRLMVNQDIDLKAKLDASLTATDPTNEWDDYTSGDPIADMKVAIDAIEDAVGAAPNVVAMDAKVFRALKDHPDILERVVYGGGPSDPALVTPRAVAAIWGLEEIIVGGAQQNTAVQGQTASMSRIWGSDVYVMFRTARPGLKTPTCAYRFAWRPFSGSRSGYRVEKFRNTPEDTKSDVINVGRYYDQAVTLAGAGYRLQNRLT